MVASVEPLACAEKDFEREVQGAGAGTFSNG